MGYFMAVAQLVNASDATLYLKTGAVNVGLVVLIVEGLVSLIKPAFIDSLYSADPAKNAAWKASQQHDAIVELLLLVLTAAGVVAFQAIGPVGIGNGPAVLALVIQAILALFTEWGIYLKVRGPNPVTPTVSTLQKMAATVAAANAAGVINAPAPRPNIPSATVPPPQ